MGQDTIKRNAYHRSPLGRITTRRKINRKEPCTIGKVGRKPCLRRVGATQQLEQSMQFGTEDGDEATQPWEGTPHGRLPERHLLGS